MPFSGRKRSLAALEPEHHAAQRTACILESKIVVPRGIDFVVAQLAANAQTREKLVAVHEIFDILVDLADVQNLSFHVYSPCSQVRTAMPMALSVENSGGEKTASKSRQDCRSCALDATPPEKTTGKPGYCFSASRVTETIHEQTQLSTYFAVSAGLPVAA